MARAPAKAAHAATFVTLNGADTVSVEHVRDVADGYVGDIVMAHGIPFVSYRVRLGSQETVARIDIAMSPMGSPREAVPSPVLGAWRDRDTVIIAPIGRGEGMLERRIPVPPSAILAMGYSIASYEQVVRRARVLGGKAAELALVEPMNGQLWAAKVKVLGGGEVTLDAGPDRWRFSTDGEGHILSGRHASGLRVQRIVDAGSLPIVQFVTAPDSADPSAMEAHERRWAQLDSVEGQVRSALASRQPPRSIESATAPLIHQLHERGGVYLARLSTEAADSLRHRAGGLPSAERYARQAIAFADAQDVRLYGESGVVAARAASRGMLGEVECALGKRDSAIATLREAIGLIPEYQEFPLQRDLRQSLAACLAAAGRDDDAIATLFESAAVDPGPGDPAARTPLHGLWRKRFGDDSGLDERIDRARGRKWAAAMGGGMRIPIGVSAPMWALPNLAGDTTRSSAYAGRPMVLVFWGSWTSANRAIMKSAESWHRRSSELGIQVVSVNWELPGSGPISTELAREFIAHNRYSLPVLLDQDQKAFALLGGEAYPQVFFIDRDGTLRRTVFGGAAASFDSLDAWVAMLGKLER